MSGRPVVNRSGFLGGFDFPLPLFGAVLNVTFDGIENGGC